MEKKAPLLLIRPQFDAGLAMIHSLVAGAIGTFVLTIGGGTFLYILLSLLGLGKFISAGHVYGFCLLAGVLSLPALFFEIKKKAYQRTVYHFHADHVDYRYYRFYLSLRRGRVRYRDISDISQQATTLQEQRRLATVYLYVPGMDYRRDGFSGLKIPDLPRAQDYMTRIMDVIEKGQQAPAAATA